MNKISLILGLLYSVITYSQYDVSISVSAVDTNNKLSNVEIYDDKGILLGTTNKTGSVTFKSSSEKQWLTIFKENFDFFEEEYNFKTSSNLKVKLAPLSETLSVVEITARKKRLFALKQLKDVEGTSIFAGKKSEVIVLSAIGGNKATNNARRIYSQVVGLNIYENDDAGLQLNIGGRGLDPNRTANFNTRQNGYDMSADVLGYPESYYTPPSDALEEIQVVRGAASLQYGTQFGGLINFKFLKPNKDKEFELITRQSTGSNGLFNTFNSVSGTSGKVAYYSYVNYKRGDGFRPNSQFNSFNIHAHVDYNFNDKTALTVEVSYLDYLAKQAGGLTDTQFKKDIYFSNRTRNWFDVKWNLWALKFKHDFSEDTKFTFDVFGLQSSRKALGIRKVPLTAPDIFENGVFTENRDLIDGAYRNVGAEARFLSSYEIGSKKQIYLVGMKYYHANNSERQGLGSKSDDADFRYRVPKNELASDYKFPNRNVAAFAEHIFKITDKLSVTPGVRGEYIKTASNGVYQTILRNRAGELKSVTYTPEGKVQERSFALFGLGLSYKHNKYIELYANASQNYRSVTFNDIRTESPSYVVDPKIADESGMTMDIGLRGKYKKYFSYDIGGFALLYNDRIGEIIVNTGPEKGDRMRTNVGDAFIYGFEGFGVLNLAGILNMPSKDYVFTNFLNLAITDSEYKTSIKSGVEGNQVEFIPFLNAKTGFKFGYKDWFTSFQYTHFTEQFTEATNSGPSEKGGLREGIIGEIPAYSILDGSVSYKYKDWKFETGVNNILDFKYFTRRATGYPGPGIIPSAPRTWFATVEYKF